MTCAKATAQRERRALTRRGEEPCQGRRAPDGRSDHLARLQRAAGNQAVQALHDRGRLSGGLEVSDSGDRAERDAERVAEAVTGSPKPEGVGDRSPAADTCSRCRRRYRAGKPLNCKECEGRVQRSEAAATASGSARGAAAASPPIRGHGRRLSGAARSYFEPRFGADFSSVRVFTGRRADNAARSVNARAFTVGENVVFRSGAYRPGTADGRGLLAHELTHVVQQRTEGNRQLQRWSYGSGTHNTGVRNLQEIPPDERRGSNGFDAAMRIIDRLATGNNDRAQHCQDWFDNNCDLNRSLRDVHARAVIWKFTERANENLDGVTDTQNSQHHGVEQELIDMQSHWAIAGNLIHEYWHDCETRNADIGDQAIQACGLPDA